ncbi:MAG: ABC transporter substrate-binding protein [Oscillospiraceae bacterium]|nr:ABC transporter substrate-binding protein [Oscillospiraceae bacterium]
MKHIKSIKPLTALLLVLAVALSLPACGDPSDGEENTTVLASPNSLSIKYNEMKMAYDKWDTLDPFKATSAMNRNLIPLMYDSLFSLSSTYEAVPQIARSWSMSGTSVTVTLNDGIVFSDGKTLTADDAAYSFDCAKKAKGYRGRLENFSSVTVTGSRTLVFTLKAFDPCAVSCLNFPVVKQYSVQTEYDDVADVKPPVGSGRYVLRDDLTLSANQSRFGSFWPQITTIRLVCQDDSSALLYSLEIGNVSFAFDDMSGGSYKRISANSAEYLMNNLVFLGMNQENPSLRDAAVRQAVMRAIDRQGVIDNSYQSHAVVAWTPFNPRWHAASQYDFQIKYDAGKAKALLEQEGFDKINSYNIRNDGLRSLTFRLIVNTQNHFKCVAARNIANGLAKLNIHVQVVQLEPEEFFEAHGAGDYDFYIGEVNLTPNMSLSPFFDYGGAAARGIYSRKAADTYYDFLDGESKLTEFVTAFNEDCPFIPLCFRKGVAASVRNLNGATGSWYGDIYRDIEDWAFE